MKEINGKEIARDYESIATYRELPIMGGEWVTIKLSRIKKFTRNMLIAQKKKNH